MAVSGTISTTTFDTLKVIDNAFRRCRLQAQAITSEMHDYARDALYLILSEIANVKTPSWCVERQLYSFTEGQPTIQLDIGTVNVLNANLRTLQGLSYDLFTATPTRRDYDFGAGGGTVSTVGVLWGVPSFALTFQISDDQLTWETVGTLPDSTATTGDKVWVDIVPSRSARYFRISWALGSFVTSDVFLGNLPQEIPMGVLNRDTYVAQSNKVFQGRPLTFWYQRDREIPLMQLWPAPDALSAERCQLVVWRHRHIMDVGTLKQSIEVPQRWMESIIASLAAKVALETPMVDVQLLPMLEQKAGVAYQLALAGDNSGSSTFIAPRIGCYTA